MITTLLLTIPYSIITAIQKIFPLGSGFGTEVHSAFSTLGEYVGLIDVFIPVSILSYCLLLIFSVEIFFFLFGIIKWVVSFIPFVGGKGNQ